MNSTVMEEVLTAIDMINSNDVHHCKVARALAVEYFEARSLAVRFLTDLGLA